MYERAEIVVVPSFGEGFGMVALEAMERGRAVIASDVGGLPEIVATGETGLVVPSGDPASLARAIVELARDPQRAAVLGAAGRERALSAFSQERCTERTKALYLAAFETGVRAALADQLPGALERERREQREQEVPRGAVTRRPGEHHRHQRVEREEERRERDEPARGEKAPHSASA